MAEQLVKPIDARAGWLERIGRMPAMCAQTFLSADDVRRLRERAREAGMRELPYPFESALAVDSDIDRSNRAHYGGYVDQLVRRHGLDFGDTVWLHANLAKFPGHGFFSRHLTLYDEATAGPRRETRLDPYEVVAEHHRGNIDHWHSFLPRGPRVIVLTESRREGETIVLPLPQAPPQRHTLFHAFVFPVLAVSVLADPDVGPPGQVTLETGAGPPVAYRRETDGDLFRFLGAGGPQRIHFYTLSYPADSTAAPPYATDGGLLRIRFAGGAPPGAAPRVYLHNVHSRFLFDRLDELAARCRVSMNLVTTHAAYHFYHSDSRDQFTRMNRDRMAARPGALEAYFGSFDEDGLRFSTLADEDASFCRVFPELGSRYGVRFLRLTGGDEDDGGITVFDLVFPQRTRIGTHVYVMRNVLPGLPEGETPDDPELARKTTARTFARRLKRLLLDLRGRPGSAAVFYTHLGNLIPDDEPTDPYFEEEPVAELRRRAFGGGGDGRPVEHRLWFTRPSVLCDYALMMQSLPEAVRRHGPDTVRITAREDPFLGVRLPESPRQLYGVTFHVGDAAAAEVDLDGRPITDLVRNPPDESGRESVTIAECGIRHVVFDEADPRRHWTAWREHGAGWTWRRRPGGAFAGECYGVLARGSGSAASAAVAFDCPGLDPVGCQHFAWAMRRSSPQARFAVVIETLTGGRFGFGDPGPVGRAVRLTASYALGRDPPAAGGWRRCVVPFYDLRWHDGDGGAMPSHPVRSVTLAIEGAPGDFVELDAVEFGRPRTTGAGDGTVVLGGRVRGAGAGVPVALRPLHGDRPAATVTTDGLGGFAFAPVAAGAYALSAGGEAAERQRRLVEAKSDRFDIEL